MESSRSNITGISVHTTNSPHHQHRRETSQNWSKHSLHQRELSVFRWVGQHRRSLTDKIKHQLASLCRIHAKTQRRSINEECQDHQSILKCNNHLPNLEVKVEHASGIHRSTSAVHVSRRPRDKRHQSVHKHDSCLVSTAWQAHPSVHKPGDPIDGFGVWLVRPQAQGWKYLKICKLVRTFFHDNKKMN
jgi:hypothetical protein